jgi:hypothetical protein
MTVRRTSEGGGAMSDETTTTFKRVLDVLSDGDWHSEDELEEVSYFPRDWIQELRVSGYPVDESGDRCRWRLLSSPKRRRSCAG